MVKTVAITIAVLLAVSIAGVLAYAATRPDTFRVQRALDIKAPPQTIFAILTDLRRSVEWSPYERKDPDMKRTYSGAASGKGAVYEWDGDKNIGAGRIEIVEFTPPEKVVLTLDMIRPIKANNIVEYTLAPNGDATKVTWNMHGRTPYLAKVIHLFFDVDKMVGKDFEDGLASLKALAEKQGR